MENKTNYLIEKVTWKNSIQKKLLQLLKYFSHTQSFNDTQFHNRPIIYLTLKTVYLQRTDNCVTLINEPKFLIYNDYFLKENYSFSYISFAPQINQILKKKLFIS